MLVDETDDLAGDIRRAMEGDSAPPEPAPAPEPAAAQPGAEAPQEGETQAQAEQRARDEQGRFAKKDEAPQDASKLAVQPEPTQSTIRPPSSWSAEAKAQFAALTPIIQQEVLKREEEIQKGKAQWDTKAESYNRLDALLAPHDERLSLAGQTRETYIRALLTADEMLRGPQKDQAFAQIARMYGVQFQPPQGQHQPQAHADPQLLALHQQVQQLTQTLTQREQAESAQQQQALDDEIQAFAADPAHLYFDNVKSEMGALLDSGAAKDLAQAYDMACHARPDIRALLAQAQAQPQQQPAKPGVPAGLSVTGSPPMGGAQQRPNSGPGGSIEDDVRAALMEVSGRI